MSGEDNGIWKRIEVNDEVLRKELTDNSDEILKKIEKEINASDLETILDDTVTNRGLTILSILEDTYKKSPETILVLYCLREFMLRKKKIIVAIASIVFDEKELMKYSNEFALVCALYRNHPSKLMDIYLRYQVHNKVFDTYSLVCQKRSRPKTNFAEMDTAAVNQILNEIDDKSEGGRSYCWHTLNSDDVTEMYIRTEADIPTLLNLLKKNVSTVLAESSIFRFHKYGRSVEVWSKDDRSAKAILNHLAENQYEKGASYVPMSFENDSKLVNEFLEKIAHEKDSRITLLKIHRANSPFDGAPEITLSSMISISPTIRDLTDLGRDLIVDAAIHTQSIKLVFNEQTITLSFKQTENGIHLVPLYMKGPNELLLKLDEYVQNNYHIRISLGV